MVFPILKRVIPPFVKLYIKKIKGIENAKKARSYIVVANHESYFDHFAIQSTLVPFLNEKIHYLAKREHFDKFLERKWHEYIGAIPVDRESGAKEAMAWAIKALHKGKKIGMYPEGTRTLTGKMGKGKTGAIRLALQAKVPLLPIGLDGCFELMPKKVHFPRNKFHSVTVNIGEPIYLDKYYGKEHDHEIVKKLTKELMLKIAKLANSKYNFN